MSKISEKYKDFKSKNPKIKIGNPIGSEQNCGDGVGKFQDYSGGFSIYYSPSTGAHVIYGKIREKWIALGKETGPNGYPTTDEQDTASGTGRYNNFQNGSIYYKWNTTEAFSVLGLIYNKWKRDRLVGGTLGYPITDETASDDGFGRFSTFEKGMIFYHPDHGTYIVLPPILNAWIDADRENGSWGYPKSYKKITASRPVEVWKQVFVGGTIVARKLYSYGLGLKAPIYLTDENKSRVALRNKSDKSVVRVFRPVTISKHVNLRTLLIVIPQSFTKRFNPDDIIGVENSYASAMMHMEDASFGMLRCDYTAVILDLVLTKADFNDEKSDADPNTFQPTFNAFDKVKDALEDRNFDLDDFDIISIAHPMVYSGVYPSPTGAAWAFYNGDWKTWVNIFPDSGGNYWWAFFMHEYFHPVHGTLAVTTNAFPTTNAYPALKSPDDKWWGDCFENHWVVSGDHPSIDETNLGEYLLYPIYAFVMEHWVDVAQEMGQIISEELGKNRWGDILLPTRQDDHSLILTSWRIKK